MRRIVNGVIALAAMVTTIYLFLFLPFFSQNKKEEVTDTTQEVQPQLEPEVVTITYKLPPGSMTDDMVVSGAKGPKIFVESGGVAFLGTWKKLAEKYHVAHDINEISFTSSLKPGEGVEFNVNFESLTPFWACSGSYHNFGSFTAVTSTGKKLRVNMKDTRQGGCNFWVLLEKHHNDLRMIESLPMSDDTCPGQENSVVDDEASDHDFDGINDQQDPDDDNDGIPDTTIGDLKKDNCQFVRNRDQDDNDRDGIGNACDPIQDCNNDWVPDPIGFCGPGTK